MGSPTHTRRGCGLPPRLPRRRRRGAATAAREAAAASTAATGWRARAATATAAAAVADNWVVVTAAAAAASGQQRRRSAAAVAGVSGCLMLLLVLSCVFLRCAFRAQHFLGWHPSRLFVALRVFLFTKRQTECGIVRTRGRHLRHLRRSLHSTLPAFFKKNEGSCRF